MALNYNNPMSDFNKKNTDMQAISQIAGGGLPIEDNKRLLPQPYNPPKVFGGPYRPPKVGGPYNPPKKVGGPYNPPKKVGGGLLGMPQVGKPMGRGFPGGRDMEDPDRSGMPLRPGMPQIGRPQVGRIGFQFRSPITDYDKWLEKYLTFRKKTIDDIKRKAGGGNINFNNNRAIVYGRKPGPPSEYELEMQYKNYQNSMEKLKINNPDRFKFLTRDDPFQYRGGEYDRPLSYDQVTPIYIGVKDPSIFRNYVEDKRRRPGIQLPPPGGPR